MKLRVLIVSPIECYPAYSGNSTRIASVHQELESMGLEVYYLHIPERPFDPAKMIHKFGTRYFYRRFSLLRSFLLPYKLKALKAILLGEQYRNVKIDDYLRTADIKFYQKAIKEISPDFVWINYTYYSKLLEYTPVQVKKILDTHDCMFLRYNSIFNFKKGFKNIRINLSDEIKGLNRADNVIAIQHEEEDFFKSNGCTSNVDTIGYMFPYTPSDTRNSRYKLLYIATGYYLNYQSIYEFLKHVWPFLKLEIKGIELSIAGAISDQLEEFSNDSSIRLLGIVDNLKELYDSVDVCINPVQKGSGLKIKNAEPLFFGKPIITTTSGITGLESFIEKGLFCVEDVGQWRNIVSTLLLDTGFYECVINNINEEIKEYSNQNNKKIRKLIYQ